MTMKIIYFSAFGALFMFLGVALGALGSHALSDRLSPAALNSFEVAVRYLLIHGIVLVFYAQLPIANESLQQLVAQGFLWGIILFSGSILVLSTKVLHALSVGFLGPVTPVGGLILLGAWGALFVYFLKTALSA